MSGGNLLSNTQRPAKGTKTLEMYLSAFFNYWVHQYTIPITSKLLSFCWTLCWIFLGSHTFILNNSYPTAEFLLNCTLSSPLSLLPTLFSPLSSLKSLLSKLCNMFIYSLLTDTSGYASWLTLGDQRFVVRALNGTISQDFWYEQQRT